MKLELGFSKWEEVHDFFKNHPFLKILIQTFYQC